MIAYKQINVNWRLKMKTVLIVTYIGNLYVCPFDTTQELTDLIAAKSLQIVMDVNDPEDPENDSAFNQWKEMELTVKSVVEDDGGEGFFDYVEVVSDDVVQKIIEAHSEHEMLNSDDAVIQHSMTTLAILRKFSLRSKSNE